VKSPEFKPHYEIKINKAIQSTDELIYTDTAIFYVTVEKPLTPHTHKMRGYTN
jgi:hypothetical protein